MGNPVILCVDDDLDGLIAREALLKQRGYDVLISTHPREALRLFASCHVDAVVLDYHMAGVRGGEMASQMKGLKPEVPIMMLSAEEEVGEAMPDEVDMFCLKTESRRVFAEAVQILLAAREHSFSNWLRDWKRKLAA